LEEKRERGFSWGGEGSQEGRNAKERRKKKSFIKGGKKPVAREKGVHKLLKNQTQKNHQKALGGRGCWGKGDRKKVKKRLQGKSGVSIWGEKQLN